MHNKTFQNELGKLKHNTSTIKYDPHKAFVERLKQQVSYDETSTNAEDTDTSDDDVCSEELTKALEAKFDVLFADLDDND